MSEYNSNQEWIEANNDKIDDIMTLANTLPEASNEEPSKTVTPTTLQQVITPSPGYTGMSEVVINAVTSESGGSGSATQNDVNFIDYDGTILYSYSKQDFLALTEMPANPTHEGLTSQGWNWSLSDAKTYVTDYGKLWIGQMYVTDDNKTRLYIHLEGDRLEPYLGFAINGTATVDWGDGTTDTVTGSSTSTTIFTQHTYQNEGDYVISISSTAQLYFSGTASIRSRVISKNNNTLNENIVYQNCLKKAQLSSNVRINDFAFYNCYSLQSITIPSSVTSIGINTFAYCYSLESITIPSGVTNIDSTAFNSCSLLQSITIPSSVTNIGNSAFAYCCLLKNIAIPSGVTNIDNYAFQNSISLESITIPSGVTNIKSYTFDNCSGIKYFYFTSYTSIPTLSSRNAFGSIASDAKIVVPDDLYEDWIAATNWSSLASYIIKESEL